VFIISECTNDSRGLSVHVFVCSASDTKSVNRLKMTVFVKFYRNRGRVWEISHSAQHSIFIVIEQRLIAKVVYRQTQESRSIQYKGYLQ